MLLRLFGYRCLAVLVHRVADTVIVVDGEFVGLYRQHIRVEKMGVVVKICLLAEIKSHCCVPP